MDPTRPSTQEAWQAGKPETVPVFTVDSLDEGGAQLCPCGIATTTPQHVTVASRVDIRKPTRKFPARPRVGQVRTAPGPYPPDLSRFTFRGT